MMAEIVSAIIGALAALVAVGLTFYLADRLTLNDSMDSKSGWRKALYNIASKNEIELADIYRIRASLRYYPRPYNETNKLSFSWMSSLIIDLCDNYLVNAYKGKKIDNNNNVQTVKSVQLTTKKTKQSGRRMLLGKFKINKNKQASTSRSTKYSVSEINQINVTVSPQTDEIVRIICRYLLKVHWESRQRMVIFRRHDLMNVDDDMPSEEAARTIFLILKQVEKMDNSQDNNTSSDISKMIEQALKEKKQCETGSKTLKLMLRLGFATLFLALIYKAIILYIFDGAEKVTRLEKWLLIDGSILEYGAVFFLILTIIVFIVSRVVAKCSSSYSQK